MFVTSSPQAGAMENVPAEFGVAMILKTKVWVEEVAKLTTLFLVNYLFLLGLSYVPR
jgi:hypothetical protein